MGSIQDAAAPMASVRIGVAARELGVTARTLRYWEELGLVSPSARSEGGERLYGAVEVERLGHIRELQKLAGLSLCDIRAVLNTEATLDDLRAAYRADSSVDSRRQFTRQAIEATEQLLGRIDERLLHLRGFRARLADKLARMQSRMESLNVEEGSSLSVALAAPTAPSARGKLTQRTIRSIS